MDPNATVTQIADALREGDMDRANELREALSEWLDTGGFDPDWTSADAIYMQDHLWKSHPSMRQTED